MPEYLGNKQNQTKQNPRTSSPLARAERRRPRQKRTLQSPTTQETRDELLRNHVGLVYHVAQQLGRVSAADSTFDDRVSAGMLGLMRAAENFDPMSGTAFSTYAAPCIRGAILDDLRAKDHVSRAVRTKARRLKSAQDELCQTLGRKPADAEVAQHLDLDLPTFWRWQIDISGASTFSLNEPVSEIGENTNLVLGDLIAGEQESETGPESLLQREQETELVRDAILQLQPQQRLVLSLSYYEELTLAQIATMLRLSESRVSQVRTKALRILRTSLAGIRG